MLATRTRLLVDNRFKKSNAEWKSLAINQGQVATCSHGWGVLNDAGEFGNFR